MTEYMIFAGKGNGTWEAIEGMIKASSPQKAIREKATDDGVYAAIPARSLHIFTVGTEQKTKVTSVV